MKIIVDENIPFIKGVLEPYFTVVYKKGTEISAVDVCNADALIIRTRTRCDAGLLEGSKVKFIGTATIGYDHIDTEYCKKNNIVYETAAGCNARAVMQYVASALANLSKFQNWNPEEKTLGIIGVGNVGTWVKWFAEKSGFNVICCDPPKKLIDPELPYTELHSLLEISDIVTVHTPLICESEHRTLDMVNDDFFRAMKDDSIFINTSRGEVVDEAALVNALEVKLSAGVVDVWNNEPVIDKNLVQKVAYATPHIAGYSLQGKANGTAIIVNKLSNFFNLPLKQWYPDVKKISPDESINWKYIKNTINNYFDIIEESSRFISDTDKFEDIRNNYDYREEYF